jgi:hypothetical protein
MMTETLFSSAKDAKTRQENLGLHAFTAVPDLATCPDPAKASFAPLRALRG